MWNTWVISWLSLHSAGEDLLLQQKTPPFSFFVTFKEPKPTLIPLLGIFLVKSKKHKNKTHRGNALFPLLHRIFCAQGRFKKMTEEQSITYREKDFYSLKQKSLIHIHPLSLRGIHQNISTKLLSPLKFYTTVCKNFIYIHCCVKTKITRIYCFTFSLLCETIRGFSDTSFPLVFFFTSSPSLLHCCAFLFFTLTEWSTTMFYMFCKNQTYATPVNNKKQ